MHTTVRKSTDKKTTKLIKEKKEESPASKKLQDEKVKKATVATPRNFVSKSSTADIYGQGKRDSQQIEKTQKKVPSTSRTSVTSKEHIKSTSSVNLSSKRSTTQLKPDVKTSKKVASTPRTGKDLPILNVTVNSPIPKKRSVTVKDVSKPHSKNVERKEKEYKKNDDKKEREVIKEKKRSDKLELKEVTQERERTKTRTLKDDEVKVLTQEAVNNNEEMINLSRKLAAKPKAFFVGLEDNKAKEPVQDKASDEEVSYEDDFESYASDFESYHSDATGTDASSNTGTNISSSPGSDTREDLDDVNQQKELKEDENMLDSGNFDLREHQRSGKGVPAMMEYIQEVEETDKKSSLTDEGFQEMSSASAGTSLHNETLFIDFSKSKEKRKKKHLLQRLEQRAKDLLSMITLHEMTYNLFELKPIPYDLYMATFGRNNYTQTASQTFEDGINIEVQTEDVVAENKWTQNPIEFTNHDICREDSKINKRSQSEEYFVNKFTFLINTTEAEVKEQDKDDESNPLRVFLEQKNGVGSRVVLPYENYKNKLKDKDYNADRLARFLNKIENRLSNTLSLNGKTDTRNLVKASKIPFSKGYVTLKENEQSLDKSAKITKVIFSKTKPNFVVTVYGKNNEGFAVGKCFMSLWDLNSGCREPMKQLIAIDSPNVAKFVGNSNGLIVAALQDGSIHVWDLSEDPTWRAHDEEETVEVAPSETLTQTEIDRQWNVNNSYVGRSQPIQRAFQASAYTSSGMNMTQNDGTDDIIGLELQMDSVEIGDDGRKVIGQIYSLSRSGVLSIWNMVYDKSKQFVQEIGKAYSSRIKLDKYQIIILTEHIDIPVKNSKEDDLISFNLNAAKKRLLTKKQEKAAVKEFSRQSSASSKFESDRRPGSAASLRRLGLPLRKEVSKCWVDGTVCFDLRLMNDGGFNYSLVAKNCGEVLCVKRSIGGFKVDRLNVANDTSSVTCLEVYQQKFPYFLAATDSGTVHIWSLVDARVLLTLDCRNSSPTPDISKCHADSKGRYVSTVAVKTGHAPVTAKVSISSLHWSASNPCNIIALTSVGTLNYWDLTTSDIYTKHTCDRAATHCTVAGGNMALLTKEGDLEIHKLETINKASEQLELFTKYLALL